MWALPDIHRLNEEASRLAKVNLNKTEKQLCRGEQCERCDSKAVHATPWYKEIRLDICILFIGSFIFSMFSAGVFFFNPETSTRIPKFINLFELSILDSTANLVMDSKKPISFLINPFIIGTSTPSFDFPFNISIYPM